jgi:hypothetical protein
MIHFLVTYLVFTKNKETLRKQKKELEKCFCPNQDYSFQMKSLLNDLQASLVTLERLAEESERTAIFEPELLDRVWSDPIRAVQIEGVDLSRFGVCLCR